MNLSEILANFLGRTVEVFQDNQLITGTLLSIVDGLFTVQVLSSTYIPTSQQVTISNENVIMIRVLPA